ncbi:MAG: LppX_LprAFG lipoprotein, partial [Chloroflexota bacterium]
SSETETEKLQVHRTIAKLICSACMVSLLAACGGGDGNSNGDGETPNAEEVLESGANRWEETETARFRLEIEGETYLDEAETIRLSEAEGALVWPASAETDASLSAGPVDADVSLIMIDGDVYMTDLMTGAWGEAPADFSYDPSILLSEDDGLGSIMRQIDEATVERAGDDLVLSGDAPADAIEPITAGAIASDSASVPVELTFDPETFDLLGIRIDGADDDRWTIELFDHDDAITIERPIE